MSLRCWALLLRFWMDWIGSLKQPGCAMVQRLVNGLVSTAEANTTAPAALFGKKGNAEDASRGMWACSAELWRHATFRKGLAACAEHCWLQAMLLLLLP